MNGVAIAAYAKSFNVYFCDHPCIGCTKIATFVSFVHMGCRGLGFPRVDEEYVVDVIIRDPFVDMGEL